MKTMLYLLFNCYNFTKHILLIKKYYFLKTEINYAIEFD